MSKGAHRQSVGHASRSVPKSPSWVVEREAIRLFSDRVSRTVLAVFHARRAAKSEEFFVSPDIARLNSLSPADLNWALDKLEGRLLTTVSRKKGKWRAIRLLPPFEEVSAAQGKSSHRDRENGDSLQPDEERLTYDKERILELAYSFARETTPEALEALNEIAAQRRRQ